MPRVVVLGTGTGVGKTHVTAALASALARLEPSAAVGALKPIETGVDAAAVSDAARLAAASRAPHAAPTRALYAFTRPVTPLLAAAHEGRNVEVNLVRDWVLEWERVNAMSRNVWSIVETAGGAFSPLTRLATNFELARALEPASWVLIAPDALGVLHDVTATWTACRALGRVPDFLVLSAARTPDASTGTNAAVLAAIGVARPIAVLGRDETELSPLAAALVAGAQD